MEHKKQDPIIEIFETINLTKTGNKVIKTIDGKSYYIGKDKQISFPLHTPVKILYSAVDNGGKTFNWINWAGVADSSDKRTTKPITPPMPPITIENTVSLPSTPKIVSKYASEDIKAFKAKDDQIRQSVALNNSVLMATSSISALDKSQFAGLGLAEVAKRVKDLQGQFYKDYYKQLSGNDGSLSSASIAGYGIEVAEYVTGPEYNSGELID